MFLRFATEGDLNGILEIERLSFPIRKQWDRSDFKQALRDLFLVSGEEELSGFLIGCCREIERRAVILRIAVHPDYRSRGIATMLIEAAIEKFREMDIREVELDVEIVKRGAIKLYEAVGFKIARGITMSDNNSMNDENGSFYLMKRELLPDEIDRKRTLTGLGMDPMWFYDEAGELEEWQAFRKEALPLEREHLEIRLALRDAQAALRADPKNENLEARVIFLTKRLEEIERKAPWISSDVPLEISLWGVPHG